MSFKEFIKDFIIHFIIGAFFVGSGINEPRVALAALILLVFFFHSDTFCDIVNHLFNLPNNTRCNYYLDDYINYYYLTTFRIVSAMMGYVIVYALYLTIR